MNYNELKELASKYYDEHGFSTGDDGIDLFVAGAQMIQDKYEAMSLSDFKRDIKTRSLDDELEKRYKQIDDEQQAIRNEHVDTGMRLS